MHSEGDVNMLDEVRPHTSSETTFVAKCSSHASFVYLQNRRLLMEAEDCQSDEDNNSPEKTKRLKTSSEAAAEAAAVAELSKEERDMVRLSGGSEAVTWIRRQCESLIRKGKRNLDPRFDGDTILMEKCIHKPPMADPAFSRRNHAQILAYAKIMAETRPELLLHRNDQDANALDLAALNDKTIVTVYLARLMESLGHDPNMPNKKGHTVLHLLARKGDDCASTLEALLAMKRQNEEERLFRIDVLNQGRKTPLDVAVICSQKYSTGKDRAIYTETIKLFQDVIIDEANRLMEDDCSIQSDF